LVASLLELVWQVEREWKESVDGLGEVLQRAHRNHGHARPRVPVAQLQEHDGEEGSEDEAGDEGEAHGACQERSCAEVEGDDDDAMPQAHAPVAARLHCLVGHVKEAFAALAMEKKRW
jgi:hypothetical protein